MMGAFPRLAAIVLAAAIMARGETSCSPGALAVSKDGRTLYVACSGSNRVEVFETGSRRILRNIPAPGPVSGLALASDGASLYITSAAPNSSVEIIDVALGRKRASIGVGHTAMAPVLSPDGATLYVCNRFNDNVSVIDTAARKEITRIRVVREPAGAALSPDGKRLFVINSLPAGRADVAPIASQISIIDTAARKLSGSVQLPNGSTSLRAIRISPDGRFACVTHLLSRYYLPTTQVDHGWMHTNAFSIIDVARGTLVGTVLLDDIDRGAANPWGVDWSANGGFLCITHAGTHELSIIDAEPLLAKLRKPPQDPAGDLSFLVGLRKRVKLAGNGPRAVVTAGGIAWVASYFSDTLESVDLAAVTPSATLAARLSVVPPDTSRKGEMLFNDGSLSFQGWLSCVSCHSPDARVDALNWDLLNDGIGNPKNVRSLLLAHRTPPAMSHAVRENAEAAVRAGIRFILFAERPKEEAAAIDEFLKSLQPMPSPLLVHGGLSPAAARGRKLFLDGRVGCAKCHPAGLFTNLASYDVGTRAETDAGSKFDTPTLIEIWRTAPYLHDGSAPTVRAVLTTRNRDDRHGKTSHLTERQIEDLAAYLLSM
ncbi:MAG: c-type cytochrome [Acidobacteriia bacterium]|nr:c-type cytochrome [Terriglobia bacterium]